jgi:DNA polymerase-3 subunit gamma/tau
VFATTELHKVPATIASRCQVFEFRRIALPALVAHLGTIAAAEGITASQDALRLVAREADGSLRDACSLLDQVISFAGMNIEADAVGEILRTGTRGAVERLLRAILAEDPAEALRTYVDVVARGMPARQLLKDLARFLSECLRVALLGRDAARETGLTEGEIAAMADLVAGRSVESLATLLNLLVVASDKAADSRSPELLAEAALVRAARLSSLQAVDGMIARLEAMARGAPGGPGGAGMGSAPASRNFAAPVTAVSRGPSVGRSSDQPASPSYPASSVSTASSASPSSVVAPASPVSQVRSSGSAAPTVSAGEPRSASSAAQRLRSLVQTGEVSGASSVSPLAPPDPPVAPAGTAPAVAAPDQPSNALPRRSESDTVDLFMKNPLFDKVLGTFGGEIRKVVPE